MVLWSLLFAVFPTVRAHFETHSERERVTPKLNQEVYHCCYNCNQVCNPEVVDGGNLLIVAEIVIFVF